MNQKLWYFLIDGQHDEKWGLFGNFYSYGQNLGEALNSTFTASKREYFSHPNLIEACELDSFEVIESREELLKLSDTVYMRKMIHSFPFKDQDKMFQPPVGIVKATGEDEYDYELIAEKFVAYGKDENGIFELELVIGRAKLEKVYLKTIDFLPSVDGFWIYIQSHWDNKKTELWVAKHFVDKQQVIEFLINRKNDTFKNGHIKIVVHSLLGETNLTLDDHKQIQFHTKDENLFNDFIGNIINLGFEQTREFYSLEFGFHHYHYKPADSLTRSKFKLMLINQQFELIDQ